MTGYLIILYIYLRQKAFQKAFDAKEQLVNLERNKVFYLENSVVMYGIYNAETIEKLVYTLEKCRLKLHEMKGYLWENIFIGFIGIYEKKEWYTKL